METTFKNHISPLLSYENWKEVELFICCRLEIKTAIWQKVRPEIYSIKRIQYTDAIDKKYFYNLFSTPYSFVIQVAGQYKSLYMGENSAAKIKSWLFGKFLRHWFDTFIQSVEFQTICDRLDYDIPNCLEAFGDKNIKLFFILWAMDTYPNLTKVLMGQALYEGYSPIRRISFYDFARYAPEFVLFNFPDLAKIPKELAWVRHLAKGYNLRTAPYMKTQLSKRAAHWANLAPRYCGIKEAILFGMVKANGGGQVLFEFLRPSYKRSSYYEINRTVQIIQFLAKYEDQLEDVISDRLIGYINHMYVENPTFSLKGRTFKALLRNMNAYYKEIEDQWAQQRQQMSKHFQERWEGFKLKDYEFTIQQSRYKIEQLLSYKDLAVEGKTLQHCVASYYKKCISGKSSIWSLRRLVKDDQGSKNNTIINRILTMELNEHHAIVQARGLYNATPTSEEQEVINAWAEKAKLSIWTF